MEFYDVLDQILDLLRRRGRMSYRALRRQFHLDDASIEDVKEELLYAYPVVDDAGRGLVWTGEVGRTPEPESTPTSASTPASPPLAYTPQHLTEKILATRTALEGERNKSPSCLRTSKIPPS
jgi:hypothetical protein